jgi:sugar transferase EpsL
MRRSIYTSMVKGPIDRVAAAAGLIALSPALAILTLAIRRRLGPPALFRQTRIGLNEKPFEFLKFRTMTDERDASGTLLPDAARLTPFGLHLRAASLDELPQLWNVVKGDMSLVGPRPLLPEYLPRYSPEQRRRHEVKPGITGLAQVSGRNALSWREKLALDVQYVDRQGPMLDLRIIWKTIEAVFRRKGIHREGHATAPPFLGDSVE